MQLNKYIAHCGITSRRKAAELVKKGLIRVNNTVVTDPSIQIVPNDIVTYQGSIVRPEKKVYILLNKPKGFITTGADPQGRPTVFDLIPNKIQERLFAVGRLDRNTTGLLLLTNDGDLGQALAHPKFSITKTYQVTLDKPFEEKDLTALSVGVRLEDGFIKADSIEIMPRSSAKKIMVAIHSGKKHIVRRMFKHLGYFVTKLDRTGFGPLSKKGIAQGRWRFLTKNEVDRLRSLPFDSSLDSQSSLGIRSGRTAVRGERRPKAAVESKRTEKK